MESEVSQASGANPRSVISSDTLMTLREALTREASGVPVRALGDAVARLSERYRAVAAANEPILARDIDVLAYAHYRMPATFAAVRHALRALEASGRLPHGSIRSMVDLGGGTGAAAWAAASVFDSIERISVMDQVPQALDLGQRLAKHSGIEALEETVWTQGRVGSWNVSVGSPAGGGADLATVSYVLSELTQAQADRIVAEASTAADEAVLIVEPGTPDGWARIMRARDQLLADAWQVAAPCPHHGMCPLAADGVNDWCHFAARVNRSSIHRQVKAGQMSYEDEKFAYVAVVREPAHLAPGAHGTLHGAPARVIRHPQKNKGFVKAQVCESADDRGDTGRVREATISKKMGETYKRARDLSWGDTIDL